jgi:hypothetical protein
MLPAFLLPQIRLPRSAVWQLYGLAFGVTGLVATLFAEIPGVTLWSAVIVASLLSYLVTIGRLVRSRRMPIDWTVRHAIAAIAWLVVAAGLGIALSWLGADSLAGSRAAAAYGALGLLGWIGNFIIGVSYQLFPGFVTRARTGMGWAALTIGELSVPRPRPFVFVFLNGGLAALAIGFLLGSASVARAASCAIAAGGFVYASVTLWTLSWTYRSSIPQSVLKNPLRILPG